MKLKNSALGLLTVSLCVLAGCSMSGTSSSSGNESLVSQEAAVATASEASAIATSTTETQVTASSGAMLARPVSETESISGCPTVDVTSSGSDGWTAETLTFAAPPCEFTGARGYASLNITGTLALTRSNGDGYNFTSDATNLEWAFTGTNATYSETRNGTRDVTASATGASVANNMTILYAGAQHSGTLTHQLAATFTPASGLSLAAGQPLPSGNFSYSGQAAWAGSDGNAGTFAISTVTPLAYDSTCKDTEPSVFDSGEIHVHLTSDSRNAYAKIVWSACGTPTVSFIAD